MLFLLRPGYCQAHEWISSSLRLLAVLLTLSASNDGRAARGTSAIEWWDGAYFTENWFGCRQCLEGHGLSLKGGSSAIYQGITHSNNSQDVSFFCHHFFLTAKCDFGKMLGLEGLTGQAGIQWQTGSGNINNRSGAGTAFHTASFTGHWKCNLRSIELTYATPEIFGIKEFFTISGGWQNPKEHFMLQPHASLFQNYAFGGGELAANGVIFKGGYLAWGSYAKLKPTSHCYLQVGVWDAVPVPLHYLKCGTRCQKFRPNLVLFMGEVGIIPELSDAALPLAKYVVGSYYWRQHHRSFFGANYPGRCGFYLQADQILYRETHAVTGHALNQPVGAKRKKTYPQGLYSFGYISHSQQSNNSRIPIFLRVGLVYKGLFTTRDEDELGIAFAHANYSNFLAHRTHGRLIQRTNEAVLEISYRFRANKWLHIQPFLEYLVHPNGDARSKDSLVLGIVARMIF